MVENGNLFAGLVFPKRNSFDDEARFGFDFGVSVVELGYDGRIIDVGVSVLTLGAKYVYKDGKFEFKYGFGTHGFFISIVLKKCLT